MLVNDYMLRNHGNKGLWDASTDLSLYASEVWFSDSPSAALVVNEGVPTIVPLQVCILHELVLTLAYMFRA